MAKFPFGAIYVLLWILLGIPVASAVQGMAGETDAAVVALSPHDSEIRVILPLPDARFPRGSTVPLHAELVVRDGGELPDGWALSFSLNDAESETVPGTRVVGELPSLEDGQHTILVQLVDNQRQGAILGPRALVTFLVGESPTPPDIRVDAPPAKLVWRISQGESIPVRVSLLGGSLSGHTPRVTINQVDATTAIAPWAPDLDTWSADLGHLPDGLHVVDASLIAPDGRVVWPQTPRLAPRQQHELCSVSNPPLIATLRVQAAADRRYFQVATRNASQPNGGVAFAADEVRCCGALSGGKDYVAPGVPSGVSDAAFDEASWVLAAGADADTSLQAYCNEHSLVQRGGGREPRFLVLDAAGIPLGNRLQFLASGFLLAILTGRVVLADMGELSSFFESSSRALSPGEACRWNFASMGEVENALQGAVGKEAWVAGGWAGPGGNKRVDLRTQAAVPVAWVEVFTCADLGTWLTESGVLTLRTNQNFAPFLYSNPFHRARLYQTFGQDAVGAVLRHFVRPAADVQRRIDAIRAVAGGAWLVGLQLRRRYGTERDRCKFSIPDEAAGGLQRTYAHYSEPRERLLMACAAALARAHGGAVRFYVSSDTPEEVAEAAAQALGWRHLLDKGAGFYVDTGGQGAADRRLVDEILEGGVGDYGNASGLRAVLDMWMLAAADDLVITPSSTYGMMAAALHGGRGELGNTGPVFPTRWGKCARMVAKQPASHSWLRVRRASCFRREMLAPEFDMLCPDCTLWACGCDGANPCASHSDRGASLEDPQYTAHLPL